MRAGRLRHRVSIQSRSTTEGSLGQVVESWTDTAEVSAEVKPLQGRELERGKQISAEVTHMVTIRGQGVSVTAKQRLRFGVRIFNIAAVLNPEERSIELNIACIEVPPL
jgi:SPP1 family predicted phage head-tail adaptor